jgi:hypothetical protein
MPHANSDSLIDQGILQMLYRPLIVRRLFALHNRGIRANFQTFRSHERHGTGTESGVTGLIHLIEEEASDVQERGHKPDG